MGSLKRDSKFKSGSGVIANILSSFVALFERSQPFPFSFLALQNSSLESDQQYFCPA